MVLDQQFPERRDRRHRDRDDDQRMMMKLDFYILLAACVTAFVFFASLEAAYWIFPTRSEFIADASYTRLSMGEQWKIFRGAVVRVKVARDVLRPSKAEVVLTKEQWEQWQAGQPLIIVAPRVSQ
jgi:hypothetical protein